MTFVLRNTLECPVSDTTFHLRSKSRQPAEVTAANRNQPPNPVHSFPCPTSPLPLHQKLTQNLPRGSKNGSDIFSEDHSKKSRTDFYYTYLRQATSARQKCAIDRAE